MENSKILLVEDNHICRLVMSRFLSGLGYESTAVETAKAAIEELEKSDFRVVITDVHMPELSGFDVCKAAHRKNAETPVIAYTASDINADEFKDSGFAYILQKPASVDTIKKVIMSFLREVKKCGE